MVTRRSVWSNDTVRELLESFVLVADEVFRLQRGLDAECQAFQGFCEEGHYGNRTEPSTTRQGIYAVTPAGAFLASVNTRSPERVAAMLQQALARWAEVPVGQRALSAEQRQQFEAVERFEDRYPEDGLVLAEYLRDLGRDQDPADWRTRAWNEDQVWFTRAEAASLVPEPFEVGATRAWPQRLVDRLACLHLVDSVRGQTPPLPASALDERELTSRIVAVTGDLIELRLTGRTRAVHGESLAVGGSGTERERGVQTTLRGRATWDRAAGRFVGFELVAIGERWGATRFNERREDLEPSPIGFAFVQAPAGHPRVAPAFWSHYRLR